VIRDRFARPGAVLAGQAGHNRRRRRLRLPDGYSGEGRPDPRRLHLRGPLRRQPRRLRRGLGRGPLIVLLRWPRVRRGVPKGIRHGRPWGNPLGPGVRPRRRPGLSDRHGFWEPDRVFPPRGGRQTAKRSDERLCFRPG